MAKKAGKPTRRKAAAEARKKEAAEVFAEEERIREPTAPSSAAAIKRASNHERFSSTS
jgi:hypothetical protein